MAGLAELTFDSQLYGAEAIQKAAYRSMHAFTLDLKVDGGSMICKLIGNITTSKTRLNALSKNSARTSSTTSCVRSFRLKPLPSETSSWDWLSPTPG